MKSQGKKYELIKLRNKTRMKRKFKKVKMEDSKEVRNLEYNPLTNFNYKIQTILFLSYFNLDLLSIDYQTI